MLSQWPCKRVDEGTDLPAAEMGGHKEHALAPVARRKVVFQSVVNGDAIDILQSVCGELRNLSEQTSEREVDVLQNALTFGNRLFGKGQFEVAHADPSKSRMEAVKGDGNTDAQWRAPPDAATIAASVR